ncbi:NADPH:adrenodoxin oxidoreductase mitochondrial precursor [Microdochium trichocladiopsis]|uniref:NADPH:adrenodoxin oxidoreductase, mitochondrial n=1 Tax=Microdochium trichocladiopsis TaxID=1682393 RepID=A0A9P9BN66_9PEZI|nr:NADPH:adrenodoxin oxidoreductase mitochondrial precursor [Microdochium trichocladiopsis]KAH7030946.1 NADPH:adrenodoxin oxidoreductase mitochondrial precursor [Microdochium trichocladiopsis]
MALSKPPLWVCTACRQTTTTTTRPLATRRVIHGHTSFARLASGSPAASVSGAARDARPFRMAVVGSGPAGFYTTYRVMSKIPQAKVDMYEALPVPYGLVRFGVAPDHPEVKNCRDKFEEVAASPGFTFIGNAAIGGGTAEDGSPQQPTNSFPQSVNIPLGRLMAHYDAVVFAYGASRDKKLGVADEDSLRNIFSAREFVGWYNGLPEYADLDPDLTLGDEAVIVGQGNVALDCARMLLENVDVLRRTDITEAAVERLRASRIRRVRVVGRRGPMQVAFTIKEARELMKLRDVGFHPVDMDLVPDEISKLPRARKRLMEVLVRGSTTSVDDASRSWSLDFALTPTRLQGDAHGNVQSMWFERNRLSSISDPDATVLRHDPTAGGDASRPEQVQFGASMVLRSIGYKSLALPGFAERGILFDDRRGVIRNDGFGRVFQQQLQQQHDGAATEQPKHKPGVYCAGWVKRGPTGVIASTMDDAFTTADVIAEDWYRGAPFMQEDRSASAQAEDSAGWDALKREVDGGGAARVVDWQAWQRIDEAEKKRGEVVGKEREKFTRTADMLAAAGL